MSCNDPRPQWSSKIPLDKLRQELENLFEVAKANSEKALDAMGIRTWGKTWSPPVDIVESDEYVTLFVDLPGVDPQFVDVSLAGNMLTIKGNRLLRTPGVGEVEHLAERFAGPFSRSIPLPVAVDPDAVTADAKNGLLTIRLAKQQTAKRKSIHIDVGPAPCQPETPIGS
jgi:HSP20 family protein